MRVAVLARDGLGGLPAAEAVAAVRRGWAAAAPGDEVVLLGDGDPVDGAGLLLLLVPVLDGEALGGWCSAAAARAAEEALPVVALAGQVQAGRRELGAAGLEAAPQVEATGEQALVELAARTARQWSR